MSKEQTILKDAHNIEIVVVSNGFCDNMVSVAQEKLLLFSDLGIKTKIVELELADKCAAWNYFIHQASNPADYYILFDADVVLVNQSGIAEIINILVKHPECRICGPKIVDQQGEVLDRVDGKCYAAPGNILRDIAIPNGIVMDDAYIFVTAVSNWYETDFVAGLNKGYVKQSDSIIISCGETLRDQTDVSYWIACRKRTIIGTYTQKHIDYCMREMFGGGELAKNISMKLYNLNPDWFLKYLHHEDSLPQLERPTLGVFLSLKQLVKYLVYCYSYILAIRGIRDKGFGHLAWKLKHRYW